MEAGVKDETGVLCGMKRPVKTRNSVGGSHTVCRVRHIIVICSPHMLIFERLLIILDIVSAHSLRIFLCSVS